MLELLCRLQAISSFAKDCHYHFNEYSQHLLADVNEDDLEKQIDLINEVCYLGQGEEAPAKKDILAGALDYIAQPSNDEKENFAKLKLMIKECLVHLEQTEAKTRGANALLDNIAMTLQQLHGLLFKTVDDAKDIEYLNSLPDLMEEENYNDEDLENESDDDVEWITVKGNHIPVKKGQSKREAIGEFLMKQEKKSYSIQEIAEERQKNPKSEKLQEMYKTNLKYRMEELQKDLKKSKEKLSKTSDSKQKQKIQDEIDGINFEYDIVKERYEKKYGEEKSEKRTPKDRQDEAKEIRDRMSDIEDEMQKERAKGPHSVSKATSKSRELRSEYEKLSERLSEIEDEDARDTDYNRKKDAKSKEKKSYSFDNIDEIAKKQGYEVSDMRKVDIEKDSKKYNRMVEYYPTSDNYEKGKINTKKDVEKIEKMLKEELNTDDIAVSTKKDSFGINIYYNE